MIPPWVIVFEIRSGHLVGSKLEKMRFVLDSGGVGSLLGGSFSVGNNHGDSRIDNEPLELGGYRAEILNKLFS